MKYSVGFSYPGPFANCPGFDDKADKACADAEQLVEGVFGNLGLNIATNTVGLMDLYLKNLPCMARGLTTFPRLI